MELKLMTWHNSQGYQITIVVAVYAFIFLKHPKKYTKKHNKTKSFHYIIPDEIDDSLTSHLILVINFIIEPAIITQ